jgi:uncharacterized C2H2 Zn-finger protein
MTLNFKLSHYQVIDIPPEGGDRCPECDPLLEDKGTDSRAVIESHPVQAERVLDRLPKPYGKAVKILDLSVSTK